MVYLLFHDVYAGDPRDSGFCSPAADRYKVTTARFDRELSGLAGVRGAALPFALTFDDGGVSFYTVIADRLEALGWHGYCFVATDFIDRRGFLTRQQIRELRQRGHVIGSHSASHPIPIHTREPRAIAAEWHTSVAVLQDILGERINCASVPGGFYSTTVAQSAAAAGVTRLFTSEPVRSIHRVAGCVIHGRFTIRQASSEGLASRLVTYAPSRWGMWAQWNTKALVKPVLGPLYMRVADWLLAQDATGR